jgi:hypothetical protein
MFGRARKQRGDAPIEDTRLSRRKLLRLGGLGAAGAAAATAATAMNADPAGAATGGNLLIGGANSPTAVGDVTELFSPSGTTLMPRVLQVSNYSSGTPASDATARAAIYAFSADSDASSGKRVGVWGQVASLSSDDEKGIGVLGRAEQTGSILMPTAPTGVMGHAGSNGIGVVGVGGTDGIGVRGVVSDGGGAAIEGVTTGIGAGVTGSAVSGAGVVGTSDTGTGIRAFSGTGIGISVLTDAGNANPALLATSQGTGQAIRAENTVAGVQPAMHAKSYSNAPALQASGKNIAVSASVPIAGNGSALTVNGRTKFSRSGVASIPKNATSVVVKVPGGLSSTSSVIATLQGTVSGNVAVKSAAISPSTGRATIYLTAKAPATLKVAWFALG